MYGEKLHSYRMTCSKLGGLQHPSTLRLCTQELHDLLASYIAICEVMDVLMAGQTECSLLV